MKRNNGNTQIFSFRRVSLNYFYSLTINCVKTQTLESFPLDVEVIEVLNHFFDR